MTPPRTNANCNWDTSGVTAGGQTYYIYGVADDTISTPGTDWSEGTVQVNDAPPALDHYPPVASDCPYQRGSDTPTVASGGMRAGGRGGRTKTIWATTNPKQSGYTVKADWSQAPGTRTLTWDSINSEYDTTFTSFSTGGTVVIWTEDAANASGVISVQCFSGP